MRGNIDVPPDDRITVTCFQRENALDSFNRDRESAGRPS